MTKTYKYSIIFSKLKLGCGNNYKLWNFLKGVISVVFPKPYVEEKECKNCDGTGWYKQPGFVGAATFPCNVCNKTGRVKE